MRPRRLLVLSLLLAAGGCSVTRPLPVNSDAASVQAYLAEHPAANLRVTERSGRRYWIHAPKVRGDSLVGRRGYDQPVRPVGVGMDQIAALHTGHFSASRTTAAIGGTLAVAGLALIVLVEESQPIY